MDRETYFDGTSYTALNSKLECVQKLGEYEDKIERGELVEVVKNPKAKTVFRMIEKECQRNSLVDLCEYWGITLNDFYEVTAAMLSGERSVEE